MRYLYLIRAENNIFKIGATGDIRRRFSSIYFGCPLDVEVVHLIDMGNEARGLEREMHHKYRGVCIKGDWYALSPEMVNEIKGHQNSCSIPDMWPNAETKHGKNGQVYYHVVCKRCKRSTRLQKSSSDGYVLDCKKCGHSENVAIERLYQQEIEKDNKNG